jgi:hypothetical protein
MAKEIMIFLALVRYLGYAGHAGEVNPNSHADTRVAGKESLVIQYCNCPVPVSDYDPVGAVTPLRTESAALTYTIPESGRTIRLIVHQAIHAPSLPHHLLRTMQMRYNDIVVNETPKFQCEVPNVLLHTVTVRGQYDEVLNVPMFIKGATPYITMGKHTQDESDT